MTVLFWDIDGTLLSTGRAGIFAWEDACLEVVGKPADFQALKTDGLTDHQIARRIIEAAGADGADRALVERLVQRYETLLPASLGRRQGTVHPGVREALDHFRAGRPDVHSMLLTGNTPAGAKAKLAHYGLAGYFEGGAFSEDTGPRSGIAARALAAARARFPQADLSPDRVLVIGDTPHDIECARAIGARTLAVATGGYTAADLSAHAPWRVFERLPGPAAFEALVDGRDDVPSGP
jgi:phosphoglycolate phosphatase-like HAD superfamily hydrolase